MSNPEPFFFLKIAINKTRADLKEIGGSNSLREKLGVEVHLKWRVMYNLERIFQKRNIFAKYYQSLETRTVKGRKCDFGIYRRETVTPTTIPVPLLIAEFKFTDGANLEKEVKSDFPKLIKLAEEQFQMGNKIFFGSIIYLQREKVDIEGFVAEKYCSDLYRDNPKLLPYYFEFIIQEYQDNLIVNTQISR